MNNSNNPNANTCSRNGTKLTESLCCHNPDYWRFIPNLAPEPQSPQITIETHVAQLPELNWQPPALTSECCHHPVTDSLLCRCSQTFRHFYTFSAVSTKDPIPYTCVHCNCRIWAIIDKKCQSFRIAETGRAIAGSPAQMKYGTNLNWMEAVMERHCIAIVVG